MLQYLERKKKKNKSRGGGSLMYIKKNLIYKINLNLLVSDVDKEIMTIEMTNNEGKSLFFIQEFFQKKIKKVSFVLFLETIS